MEALGGVASAIAVVGLCAKILDRCKIYMAHAKEARQDMRKIVMEITTLRGILEALQFLEEHDADLGDTETVSILDAEGPGARCFEAVTLLDRLLPAAEPRVSVRDRLAWPLKRAAALSALDDIERSKSAMSLALTIDQMKDVKDIKTGLDNVQQVLSDGELQKLFEWLSPQNPSGIHSTACDRYEPGTGSWMLRHPDWQAWIDLNNSQPRCLWIPGIPGSGKTVLASYLFTEIDSLRRRGFPSGNLQPTRDVETTSGGRPCFNNGNQEASVSCIYYCCHHTRNHDEAPHFIRWMITELCRGPKIVPQRLTDLYRTRHQPSLAQLLDILELALQPFDAVFVILDAVDESIPRDQLLKVLRGLTTDMRFVKMRITATSRVYLDISTVMEEISTPISLSNTYVARDIRKYISARLDRERNTVFKNLSADFLEYATKVLASKADGMFQWAVCQLDTIRRLKFRRTESQLRDTLDRLPKDLYTTYERIFQLILEESEDDYELVRDALTWILRFVGLVSDRPLPTKVLLQAIYPKARDEDCYTVESERLRLELRDVLGCLVDFKIDSKGNEIPSLSHYTVAEFLESGHLRSSKLAHFAPIERDPFFKSILIETSKIDLTDSRAASVSGSFAGYIALAVISILRWWERSGMPTDVKDVALDILSSPVCVTFMKRSLHADNDFHDRDTFGWLTDDWDVTVVVRDMKALAPLCCSTRKLQLEANAILWLIEAECYSLVTELMTGHGSQGCPVGLLTVPFRWTSRHGFWGDNGERYEFDATIAEFVALSTTANTVTVDGVLFLFRHCKDELVRQTPGILLYALSGHTHRRCDEGGCIVPELVENGAIVNSWGYRMTPLQIAVAHRDYDCVKCLIGAGVDVNGTGADLNGASDSALASTSRSPFSIYESLSGYSPLYINRNVFIAHVYDDHECLVRRQEGSLIERILIEHEALELRLNNAADLPFCDLDDRWGLFSFIDVSGS